MTETTAEQKTLTGSCLCGAVAYEIDPPFKIFQYCHCKRCRKYTGTAHASNLFCPPEQFRWTKGEDNVGRYEVPEAKYFSTGFCKTCGSNMPWAIKGGKNIIVTAGSLDDEPPIKPQQSIFWDSRAEWYQETCDLKKFAEFPTKG